MTERPSGLEVKACSVARLNRNLSIGLLKSDLIYILIESDAKRKAELLQALYDEIRVNVVPIRPDRHYHRTKGQLAADFSNTHKRSFEINIRLYNVKELLCPFI